MLDLCEMSEDNRNEIREEGDTKYVRLHRDHSTNLITGVYIARILWALRKLSMKKSKKPFALDPTL